MDFKVIMSKKADADLISIVTLERNDYQPSALEAAEEEIKKRAIDPNKIEEVKSELEFKIEREKAFDELKVNSLTRFFNFIVDTLICITLVCIFMFIAGILYGSTILPIWMAYLILFATFLGYYIFMEHNFQKTIGKYITGTKVLTSDDHRASLGDIIRRTLLRLVPFDNISYLITTNGFHDKLSGTRVVKDARNG